MPVCCISKNQPVGHPHRGRSGIGIGRGETAAVGDGEARIGKLQRIAHMMPDDIIEGRAGDGGKHGAQHIDRHRIFPGAARREFQRMFREPCEILLKIEIRIREAIGEIGIRPIVVAQARSMREEMAQRDRWCRSIRKPRLEVGQVAATGSSSLIRP